MGSVPPGCLSYSHTHTIVVALEKIHMKSFLGTLFFSPLLVFGKWIHRGPASPYILIS